jgi:hypothetical protein
VRSSIICERKRLLADHERGSVSSAALPVLLAFSLSGALALVPRSRPLWLPLSLVSS